MDYKNIVEKAIKKEDYSADIKDFTAEQKTELATKIAEAAQVKADEALGILTARQKEVERRENPKPADEVKILERFKNEQETQAKTEFFSNPDYSLSDAEKSTFDDIYKKLYSGEVSKEGITSVLKRVYGALKPDELIVARKKVKEGEDGARKFNSDNAGPGGSGPTQVELDKYSPATKALFQEWQKAGFNSKNYTLDRAKGIIEGGMSRNL